MLAQRLIHKAVDEGDVSAIRLIYDRVDGKPKETIELSEKRDDIPTDPEERRALAERIEQELGLTRQVQKPEGAGAATATASRKANDKAGKPTAINTPAANGDNE
jgi:hypothetical protein